MKYYAELIKHMDRSMKAHPRSTVVMDSGSFKVIACGRDPARLSRKLRRGRIEQGIPVIFRRPDRGVVWILCNHPIL